MILLDTWVQQALGSSMLLAIPVAIFAGLASFASPCVLPLLPAYLSYASGLGAAEIGKQRNSPTMLLGTLGFVAGFGVIFVATGLVLGGVGTYLLAYQRIIMIVVGIATIVLGAMFAGLIPLHKEFRLNVMPKFSVAASPLLGAVFALGWTPCIGPALGTVMSLSLNEGSSLRGGILGAAYTLGLGLPFIVFGAAFSKMTRPLEWLKRHQRGVQLFGGIALIVVGVALATGLWDWFLALTRQWLSSIEAPI